MSSTPDRDPSGYDILKSKRALERTQRAQEAVKAATEAQSRVLGLKRLTSLVEIRLGGMQSRTRNEGGDPEEIAALEKRLEEYTKEQADLDEEWRVAAEEERRALEELAHACGEFEEATVVPRVEGLKLQFETRKLQATLSAAVVLGTATITELLLPPDPAYAFLLWAAYAAFLLSLYGSLSDMQRLAIYVENVLVSGRSQADGGLQEKVAGWMLEINRRLLSFGVLLFAVFVTLNLA